MIKRRGGAKKYPPRPARPVVTRRRQAYLDCLRDGCTTEELAARLSVTVPSAKRMLRVIGDQAGVARWDWSLRRRIVRWAIAYGYIGGDRLHAQENSASRAGSA